MPKILLVDDSEAVRAQLRRDLEGAGHVVLEAGDGLDGIQKFEQNAGIQLILCDVNMPVMDGLTMCEQLFKSGKSVNVPKIMITTEIDPAMKQRAKAAGVTAWIVKPYAAEKLLQAISKIVK